MRAITLWPEWAFAICHLGKRVENRSWVPPLRVGERFAIHAGKNIGGRPGSVADREGLEAVACMAGRSDGVPSGITLRDVLACPKSAIVCTAVFGGYDREERTGWDVPGQVHWRLRDVVVLPKPVPMSGKQGLWSVPDGLLTREPTDG